MNLSTPLKGRTLRFDGVNVIHPDDVAYFIYRGVSPSKIQASVSDDTITQFNDQVPEEDAIKVYDPKAHVKIDLSWQVPPKYLSLDLVEYFSDRLSERMTELNYSESEIEEAYERLGAELEEVEVRGMVEFMQTIIYILDTFRETGQVWGVGRGSSCASYLLFIAGLHVVDCVKLGVDMAEFFHD
jgi:DNA polymerase III alpha subunit